MSETSTFLKELDEQPAALRRMVDYYSAKGLSQLKQWAVTAKKNKRIIFSGMGTSEFAPEMILADLAGSGIEAATIDAGEWLHYPRLMKALPVLISQSGESAETRALAQKLQIPYIGLINNENSLIGRKADLALLMCAGKEAAISTKTYVNTLGVLFLMAKAVRGEKDIEEGLAALKLAADRMNEYDRVGITEEATLLAAAHYLHFVSRGPAMAAARQAALTFMEGTRLSATALTGGAFRHGPFELAGEGHHAVFFAPSGSTYDLLSAMALEAVGKGSKVVVITDGKMAETAGLRILRVPDLGENLFPVAAAMTQERLLYETARQRGVEAGRFRYGAKITARE